MKPMLDFEPYDCPFCGDKVMNDASEVDSVWKYPVLSVVSTGKGHEWCVKEAQKDYDTIAFSDDTNWSHIQGANQ